MTETWRVAMYEGFEVELAKDTTFGRGTGVDTVLGKPWGVSNDWEMLQILNKIEEPQHVEYTERITFTRKYL